MTFMDADIGNMRVEEMVQGEAVRNLGAMAKGFVTVIAGGVFLAAIATTTSLLPLPDQMSGLSAPAPSPSLVQNSDTNPCAGQDWPYLSAKCLSDANGRTVTPPDRLIVHEQMPEPIREKARKIVTTIPPFKVVDAHTVATQ